MVESCHLLGVLFCLVSFRYCAIRELRVDGPVEGGKRYMALRKTGGSVE